MVCPKLILEATERANGKIIIKNTKYKEVNEERMFVILRGIFLFYLHKSSEQENYNQRKFHLYSIDKRRTTDYTL